MWSNKKFGGEKMTKILIIPKLDNPGSVFPVVAVIHQVVHELNQHYPLVKIVDDLTQLSTEDKLLVIAVGGDGTMLEAMKIASFSPIETYVVGINLGTVGFLTDFVPDEKLFDHIWQMILDPLAFPIENRIGLQLRTINDTIFAPAFNEFSISSETSDTMIKYHLYVNNHNAGEHRANSILIGTPTGSTAYTLSAGGGLLLPTMEAMQIVPVAPFSLTSRPIITSSKDIVTIKVTAPGNIIVRADGNSVGGGYKSLEVSVTQGPRVNIVHSNGWNYFNMLTQKLGWKSV